MATYLKGKPNAQLVAALEAALADTFLLYYKTHAYHWNVTGPNFGALHDFFGDQYKSLWDAVDNLAERIRALGGLPPTSLQVLIKSARLTEARKSSNAAAMIKDLLADHEKLVGELTALAELADEYDDLATENMVVDRIEAHEKMAWMLRAHA
jgi:starvation-inducible DNA-binding protein